MEPDTKHRTPQQWLWTGPATETAQGVGLFTGDERIPADTFLGEYFGKRLQSHERPTNTKYIYNTSRGRIDARLETKCRMRFINHREAREANAIAREMKADGRIFIITKTLIKPYTEVFLNYGPKYDWTSLETPGNKLINNHTNTKSSKP
jgi:hypothetical protein